MGLFRRKNKVLDLTKHYEKQQEKLEEIKQDSQEQESSASPLGASFSMFGDVSTSAPASSSDSSDDYADLSTGIDEKKRKLVKRIMDMTSKMEDLSNQIYHLEQRIEVLERKNDVSRF